MALAWGWFPFVCGGWAGALVFFFWDPNSEPPYDGASPDSGSPAIAFGGLMLIFAVFVIWAFCGAVTGVYAAWVAPESEPLNPFKSRFFRRIDKEAFWFWMLLCLILQPAFMYCSGKMNAALCSVLQPPEDRFEIGLGYFPWFYFSFHLAILAWAIQRALRSTWQKFHDETIPPRKCPPPKSYF